MKLYLVSLAAGVLVGLLYGLIQVRSPAPPVVALVGLLGILLGEQVVPVARRVITTGTLSLSALNAECGAHIFGELPGRARPLQPQRPDGITRLG